MASLRHLWNGNKLTIQNKLRIVTTCVFCVFLYASETWTLEETDKKKLLAFEMKCYRRILRKSWKDIRKTIAREETIIDTIKKRKLKLFGHICGLNNNRLIKHTIFSRRSMENLEEVIHVENDWTISRTGVDRTCSIWIKTNACGRN